MKLSTQIDVARPPEDVFEMFADLESWPEFAPAVIERRKLTEGPIDVGSRFHAVDQFPGKKLEFTLEITGYEPGRLLAGAWSDPVEGSWRAHFRPNDTGTTLEMNVEMILGGAMKLMGSLMGPWAKGQMRKDLLRFKERAEAAAEV